MKYKHIFFPFFLTLVAMGLLAGLVKGAPNGNGGLLYQIDSDTRVGGALEASNSTSRYALVQVMVDKGVFFFDDKLARFASPDLVRYNDKYFSLFTPGVAFVSIPFYVIGKVLGLPQLVTYLSTLLFGVINLILIAILARKLGSSLSAGLLAGFIFLFGTYALPYVLTLTQHHLSVTMMLLGLVLACGRVRLVKTLIFGAVFGVGLLVDIPNGLIMLPMMIWLLAKHLAVEKQENKIVIGLKLKVIFIFIGLLPFVMLFGWYNQQTTGSYTKIAQFIGRTDYPPKPETELRKAEQAAKSGIKLPYSSRNQLNGFYILALSDERGLFYFSPILLIGFLGLINAYKKRLEMSMVVVIWAMSAITIVSYASFSDPWGGWSFGPRYLIPVAAMLTIGIGRAVSVWGKKIWFLIGFFVLAVYSLALNSLGALTTNAIPPKVEAVNLLEPIPYTYEYNLQLMDKDQLSSLFYNFTADVWVSGRNYWYTFTLICFVLIAVLYTKSVLEKNNNYD